jgi:soluble lytic murein transglycosylase-like protein
MTAFSTAAAANSIFLMHGISRHRSAFQRRDRDAFTATKGNTMINRFIGTSARLVQTMARQPVTWTSTIKAARGLLTTAQHTLTIFGLSAVAVLALLYTRPDLARHASELLNPQPAPVQVPMPPLAAMVDPHRLEATEASAAEAPAAEDKPAASSKQQQFVTHWLSRRYRVAGDAANMLVSTTYQAAHDIKIDPLLVLAVMAIESGLNPFAESPVGAKGLMQVMAKVHHDKFDEVGGAQAALNPVANIRVGAQILKDYVTRSGSVEAGLKTYVGAGALDNDSGYGSKVLAEYRRLKQVAGGKNVPIVTAPAPTQALAEKAAPAKKPGAEAIGHGQEALAGL